MKSILSIILILAAAVLFFFFTKPKLAELKASQLEVSQLEIAENAAKRLKEKTESYLTIKNNISDADNKKMEAMLPNNVENVKIIIDFDNTLQSMIAERGTGAVYGNKKVSIENPKISQVGAQPDGNFDASKLGVMSITFSVSLTYSDFIEFLRRIEYSTRITDIESVSFSVNQAPNQINSADPIYTFNIGLKTYWLKYISDVKTNLN